MCEVESLLQGDKVKLTITFKGREMQFQEIGRDLFKVLPCSFVEPAHDLSDLSNLQQSLLALLTLT